MDLLSYFTTTNGALQIVAVVEVLDYLAGSPALSAEDRRRAIELRNKVRGVRLP